jgi:hypothetical protein
VFDFGLRPSSHPEARGSINISYHKDTGINYKFSAKGRQDRLGI